MMKPKEQSGSVYLNAMEICSPKGLDLDSALESISTPLDSQSQYFRMSPKQVLEIRSRNPFIARGSVSGKLAYHAASSLLKQDGMLAYLQELKCACYCGFENIGQAVEGFTKPGSDELIADHYNKEEHLARLPASYSKIPPMNGVVFTPAMALANIMVDFKLLWNQANFFSSDGLSQALWNGFTKIQTKQEAAAFIFGGNATWINELEIGIDNKESQFPILSDLGFACALSSSPLKKQSLKIINVSCSKYPTPIEESLKFDAKLLISNIKDLKKEHINPEEYLGYSGQTTIGGALAMALHQSKANQLSNGDTIQILIENHHASRTEIRLKLIS
jgi:hypothetical protein